MSRFCRPLCRSLLVGLVLLGSAVAAVSASATVRIKDIATFEGVRENMLVGYGLVVGLDGTGDSLRNANFTQESLVAMLERLGVSTRGRNLNTRNVAAVMVTATLPPFARQGGRIDIAVSAMGDAKSLAGGTLLVTPLVGADGEVYAVAQGALATSGFQAEGDAEQVTRGVPTTARIPNGAIVEREVEFALDDLNAVHLSLRNPDFTTAGRMAAVINGYLRDGFARAIDPATVRLPIPGRYDGRIAALMTEIEQLRVLPDNPARIVIDESNGIIVIGENVRIDRVAVAQGNLTVRVTETPEVVQPEPFGRGETAELPRTQIEIDDDADQKLAVLDTGVTLDDLVAGLNALGIGPRDMISIIQAIKAAGALQAEIEVR
jgi:flagellar P-ring protein precursor FlgI